MINGVDCPVTNLFDIDGVELGPEDTLDKVCSLVAELPNGQWAVMSADISDLRALS